MRDICNPAEEDRTDIWAIERDGSNVNDVMDSIVRQFTRDGLSWFAHMTDLETTFVSIKQQRASFLNMVTAIHFAKHREHEGEYVNLRARLEIEAKRIGRALNV